MHISDPTMLIVEFIKKLTNLTPYEKDDGDKYTLLLGYFNPLEIGFYRHKHPNMNDENMKMSAHLRLLHEVSVFITNWDEWCTWLEMEESNNN
jgi:hypothetical protein